MSSRRRRAGGDGSLVADVAECLTCGRPLGGDGGDDEDDPTGDGGRPICGECARSRHYTVLDYMDGELDAEIP